jgi:hypothetical protein
MAAAPTAPVKYAGRSYIIECAATQAIYVGATLVKPWLMAHAPNHAWAMAAAVLPAVGIWLLFGVVWRYYQRIDEFERHKFLVTLAISFGIGSCSIVTYTLLMDAGLPPLAITWAWPTLAVSWILTTAIMQIAGHTR